MVNWMVNMNIKWLFKNVINRARGIIVLKLDFIPNAKMGDSSWILGFLYRLSKTDSKEISRIIYL